jgi:hypothetical protein
MTTTSALDLERFRFIPGVSEVADIDLDETPVYINGKLYTEADAERDADEAERRLHANLIPGGKSLSRDGGHSPALRTVVSEETARRVKERAKAAHMSVSRYLRGIIEQDLAKAV